MRGILVRALFKESTEIFDASDNVRMSVLGFTTFLSFARPANLICDTYTSVPDEHYARAQILCVRVRHGTARQLLQGTLRCRSKL